MLMLTATHLRWLNTCHRHLWRDVHRVAFDRLDKPSAITLAALNSGIQHEAKIHQITSPVQHAVPVRSWKEGVAKTKEAMGFGDPVILGSCLEVISSLNTSFAPMKFGGRLDRLERQANGLYFPIEIKQYKHINDSDVLQLEFYVWLLCKLQRVDWLPATFWLGADKTGLPSEIVQHDYDPVRFGQQLTEAINIFNENEPNVQLIPECKRCFWHSSCYSLAAGKKHITLLSRLQPKTRQAFAAEGIESLEQIAAMQPNELRRFPGIKSTAESIHASARAWVGEQAVWYGILNPICRTNGFIFDIETYKNDYEQDEIWSIGWSDADGKIDIVIVAPKKGSNMSTWRRKAQNSPKLNAVASLLSHSELSERNISIATLPDNQQVTLVPDSHTAWLVFAEAVSRSDSPIFHWSPFDATIMRKSAPSTVTQQLAARMNDLCKLFDSCVKLPVKGTSLKVVAQHFGFEWQGSADWLIAYNHYLEWRRSGSKDALASACMYQRDDVKATLAIHKWLNSNTPNIEQ